MTTLHPVILCGGSGTRLWPRSRADKPKPFLPLVSERTLFQETLARCGDRNLFGAATVVAGEKHLAHVEDQAETGGIAEIIVEPAARNTAPAIALAAHRLPADALMLVCPSDHHIADSSAFAEAARRAGDLADEDWLVSLAIEPTRPETGFGYTRRGEPVGEGFRVERFVEKPDRETAERFLAEGGYSWNGGIFVFRAGAFLAQLERHRPDIADRVEQAVARGRSDGNRFHPEPALFAGIPTESVDYAVMEKTDRAAMVPVEMGWSDIGNWQALRDARSGDAAGNRVRGAAELLECRNVIVDSDGPRVSVIGLEDVVIVVDRGEVLVTSAKGAQRVGTLKGVKAQ